MPPSTYIGPSAQSITVPERQRKRRRLEDVKCDFCRRDEQKCLPSDRQWPGEKCQRCNAKGFSCSAPTMMTGVSDEPGPENNTLLASAEDGHLHEQRAYCSLAEKCIRQMCSSLKRNICNLDNPNTKTDSIPRSHIADALSKELQYACRFWVLHLARGKDVFLVDVDLQDQVYKFLKRHFLYWLEALSLLGLVYDGISSLLSLEHLVNNVMAHQDLRNFVRDAKRFILRYGGSIKRFPMHLYSNALLSSPPSSLVRISNHHILQDLYPAEACWGTLLTTLEGHRDEINVVTFSPDGKLLASASTDSTVKLWDSATGRELRTLKVHNDVVHRITFSPDSKQLASTSRDRTVKLWDLATGRELRILEGHNGMVKAITFSPDGKLLASASGDTVKLWDLAIGREPRTLRGHNHEVYHITFSPDSKQLVSASEDHEVLLWDLDTGKELQTWLYDGDGVVALSQDGKMVATTSRKDILLWDSATGEELGTFVGHKNYIWEIVISPDNKLLASASEVDATIKLWDLTTGEELQTLEGYAHIHTRLAFSPDSNLLAAYWLCPGIIALWDRGSGWERRTLEGHSDTVLDIAFSPDSKTLASASEDKTAKLWELYT